jgi:recombinational DNA repair protein RecT
MQNLPQPKNKVGLTAALINEQKSARALLELPQIENAWIANYEKVTGRQDGELRFNAEKILFLKRLEEDRNLKEADKFSLYVAFSELAISGGTLRDGICYIVAFGKKAQFLPGWKFRLEQISELDSVVHCQQAQVVYDCDQFQYEKGMRTVIKKHSPGTRAPGSKITHVYLVVEFKSGPEVYIMDAIDVIKIRNRYSKSWKAWVADCAKVGQDPEQDKNISVEKSGQNGNWTQVIEPPMWVKDEAEAYKKTVIHRAWKAIPGKLKKAKDRIIDERLKAAGRDVEINADDLIIDENDTAENDSMAAPETKPDTTGAQSAPPASEKKEQVNDIAAGF